MSDWKASAVKRRNFRHAKEPVNQKHYKNKSKIKKSFKVVCYFKPLEDSTSYSQFVFGRYSTLQRALTAIKSKQNDVFYKKCKFKIEKNKKENKFKKVIYEKKNK